MFSAMRLASATLVLSTAPSRFHSERMRTLDDIKMKSEHGGPPMTTPPPPATLRNPSSSAHPPHLHHGHPRPAHSHRRPNTNNMLTSSTSAPTLPQQTDIPTCSHRASWYQAQTEVHEVLEACAADNVMPSPTHETIE